MRFIPSKFVQEFFDSGSLRLSTFPAFNGPNIPDHKRDAGEGKSFVSTEREGGRYVGITFVAPKVLVLCASMIDTPEQAKRLSDDGVSGFRIRDLDRFAHAVGESLPGCHGLAHGPCNYDGRVHSSYPERVIELTEAMRHAHDATMKELMMQAFAELKSAPVEQYFAKETCHRGDAEYRFVWFMDREIREPETHVCPAARAFCEGLR